MAARFARADVVKLERHGSRSRDHAFDVKLEGESRRRPNGGSSGVEYGSGYAATWDQWGVFLAVLFDLDPNALTPYDSGREAFTARTHERFMPTESVEGVTLHRSTNANVVNVPTYPGSPSTLFVQHVAAHYWPEDAHGDHRFEFVGVPRSQSCRKCSAVQSW
jgi:hypothetical protein